MEAPRSGGANLEGSAAGAVALTIFGEFPWAGALGGTILVYLKCPGRETFRLHILRGAFIF